MSKILFISSQDLEENCNLSEAVYYNDLDIITQMQQLKYIRPLLSRDLYNELINEIETASLSTPNANLIEEIKPYLAWLVYAQYTVKAHLHSTASGIVKNNDENFTIADKEELGMLSKDAKQNADIYRGILIDYLRENKDSYPLWEDECDNDKVNSYTITRVGGRQNIERRRVINVYDSPRGNK